MLVEPALSAAEGARAETVFASISGRGEEVSPEKVYDREDALASAAARRDPRATRSGGTMRKFYTLLSAKCAATSTRRSPTSS